MNECNNILHHIKTFYLKGFLFPENWPENFTNVICSYLT